MSSRDPQWYRDIGLGYMVDLPPDEDGVVIAPDVTPEEMLKHQDEAAAQLAAPVDLDGDGMPDDYNQWIVPELKDEIDSRNADGRAQLITPASGKKADLIEALELDDAAGAEETEE